VVEDLVFGAAQGIFLNGASVAVFEENANDANFLLAENILFSSAKIRHCLHDFRKVGVRIWTQLPETIRKVS
jgi:hypothetical protein